MAKGFNPKAFATAEAKRQGVPPWVILAMGSKETGWNHSLTSSAGAQGYLQLMPGTAKELGVNPLDPKDNIRGGITYFKQQLQRFGRIDLALAAYNAGPGRVTDGSWKKIAETADYVRTIMKAKGKQHSTAAKPVTTPLAQVPTLSSGIAAPPPVDIGKAIGDSAFTQLGKIAQGADPTETLGDLVVDTQTAAAEAARAVAVQPAPAPAAPGNLTPSPVPQAPSSAKPVKGLVLPLKSKLTSRSEFGTPDAEGAPSARGGRFHAAKDWFAPPGSAVFAPVKGRVVEVKASRGNSGQVFGGVVKVQDANGRVYVFRHVDPFNVRVGEVVRPGETIARVTRWADSPSTSHAHVEVWKTLEGGYRYENMLDPTVIFRR